MESILKKVPQHLGGASPRTKLGVPKENFDNGTAPRYTALAQTTEQLLTILREK